MDFIQLVESGETLIPETVHLTLQRHKEDLVRSKSDDFNYYYDEVSADRIIRFIETLRYRDGLKQGEIISLQPWQIFFLRSVFGWKKKGTTFLRFSIIYLSVPRKTGKSALISWVAIYMMFCLGTFAFSGTSVATNLDQAQKTIMSVIKDMITANPSIAKLAKYTDKSKEIAYPKMSGKFYVKASEGKAVKGNEGWNEDLIIFDEFHTQDAGELYSVVTNSLGSKNNQLLFVITTAGSNTMGFAKAHEDTLIDQLRGTRKRDEKTFSLIYRPDPDDDLNDPITWRKVNPNYGVSFTEEQFESLHISASAKTSEYKEFLIKRLNYWTTNNSSWLSEKQIEPCFKKINIADFVGDKATLAVDLSLKDDLTAYTITFEKDGIIYNFFRAWIPEDSIEQRMKVNNNFEDWVLSKQLRVCKGTRINPQDIFDAIKEDSEMFDIQEISFDPSRASDLADRIEEELEIPVMKFDQYHKTFTDPSDYLEDLIDTKQVIFNDNPVARWCFLNAEKNIYRGNTSYYKPMKPEGRDELKVDLLQTTIMSVWRFYLLNNKAEKKVVEPKMMFF